MGIFERNDIAIDLGTVNTIVRNDMETTLFAKRLVLLLKKNIILIAF